MKEINGATKVTGIIGYPLTYTFSPPMHNKAFEALNLNYRYLPFVVEPNALENAIEGIKSLNIRGINVTMPHKEAVIDLLDELSAEAETIGAVNTINNDNGRLIGYNTDAGGFLKSLKEESFNPAGKTAIILGTGGAAKAVAVALAQAGAASIVIIGRSGNKAEAITSSLISNFQEISGKTLTFRDNLADIFQIGELIVNATPVGMKESGDLLPVPLEFINASHFVYDLIYTPLETALINGARHKGAKAANGLGMLLYQAASAFEIWTGTSAPVEVMRQALIQGLKSGDRPDNAEEENRRVPT
ncbi:MAG: shikimate dehydrogenase [Candidatus Aquicultor secundus]|nr:MAG: shikimate dehydrogenase [Candidatus Aquicultor secundus]PIX52220.1 MAG: shikimate dehydrogenase [Candidatus Aquicultor secundus]